MEERRKPYEDDREERIYETDYVEMYKRKRGRERERKRANEGENDRRRIYCEYTSTYS